MKIDDVAKKYPILKNVIERIKEVDKVGKLFPPQEEAIKLGALDSRNFVLAVPTCSGKTLVAELAMLKAVLESGKKAIYIVPLKALASEKYEEFKEKYTPLGIKIAISIGDMDSSDPWLTNKDIIFATSEKMESLLRHNVNWLDSIGLVVADEVHLLDSPERGPTLEVLLTKLRMVCNPTILALSATINNHQELAEWLEAKAIKSNFRPVKLYKGICFNKKIKYQSKKDENLGDSKPELLEIVEETVSQGKQSLVFVNTRRGAERTAERIGYYIKEGLSANELKTLVKISSKITRLLESPTKQCERLAKCIRTGTAFHHAGLTSSQRSLIEKYFRNGLIKVITATPTLCLHKDTKIWNGISEKPVHSLNLSNEVLALKGSKLKHVKIKNIYELESPGRMVQIITKTGKQITVTVNHRMLIKRKKKRLLLSAGQCSAGDRIATAGKISIESPRINSWSDFVKNNKLPFKDCELDKEVYYLIGAFLGDGYSGAEIVKGKIKYKGPPAIVGTDEKIFGKIKSVCKKYRIFYKEIPNHYGIPQLVLTKAKWFREFLVRCGIDRGTKKHIPFKLLMSDRKKLKHLIRGLFDTDGYVLTGKSVGFSSISEQLVQDVQKALLRYGIITWKRTRDKGELKMHKKTYHTKKQWEISISHSKCILRYYKNIGFDLERKRNKLREIIKKIGSKLNAISCKKCEYTLHTEVFTGRTKMQKKWGKQKKEIVNLLGQKGELGSREITRILGYIPRKGERRLNHHYELIKKRKHGANEWLWSLNELGFWVYHNILKTNLGMRDFFAREDSCPLCGFKLNKKIRKNWRGNDFEGDIFWDIIKKVETICSDSDKVYDLALPDDGRNDHLFIANGFIVHNSFGLNLPSNTVVIKDLKRFSSFRGMDYLPALEIEQMAGRAGRLKYDNFGRAVLLCKSEAEARHAWENYIMGETEKIHSKLGVEPVLRMHVLALIASGAAGSRQELLDFFFKTFYAHQYQDLSALKGVLDKVLNQLEKWRFVETEKTNNDSFSPASSLVGDFEIRPTRIGRRVSELYIDPLTANRIIEALGSARERGVTHFSLLYIISDTVEMRPLLSVRKGDMEVLNDVILKEERHLGSPPQPWSFEYDIFLKAIKTACLLQAWSDEAGEDRILEEYSVTPGELRARLERADWLLYSAQELALLLGYMNILKDIRKTRLRLKYGIREELLPFVRLKGIGRVRARALYSSGIRSIAELRKVPLTSLERLIGAKTARDVKRQVGI